MFTPPGLQSLVQDVYTEFSRQKQLPLPLTRFTGAGIYALYYRGSSPLYGAISKTDTPIYVGKAVPSGSRRGGVMIRTGRETELYRRLCEHTRSIELCENLAVGDFQARFLSLHPDLIVAAENDLIHRLSPVWNACLDGFGLHRPGTTRETGKRSLWDTVHPGRAWAAAQPANLLAKKDLEDLVRAHFK